MRIIDFKESKCMHCYKCVRYCDVKAVMIKDGRAEVIEDKCVLCGHCLHVCPQSAKTMASDLDTVKYYIRQGHRVVVSLAPAYMGFFQDAALGQIHEAFRKLGFFDVRETAEGAAAVTAEYTSLLEEGQMDNIITTCCPSVNDLIEIYYPKLVPYMAPVVSPMVAHGRMLKKEYGVDTKVVFVGPCIAKKKESTDPRNAASIDAVLNFNDVKKWLQDEQISPANCEDIPFAHLEPKVNQLYPVTGGVISSVLSTGNQTDSYRKLHIHGTKNCIEFCDSMMAGEIRGSFIEMNMCTGGCINGSAPLYREVSRFRVKIDMEERISREPADGGMLRGMSEGVGLKKQYRDRSTNDLMPTEEQIREILAKTGKKTPEDELNCGACGYSTCREKAIAVFQKKAELNMCIPYMHDRAESLANLVMDTSPNLVMIVDGDMKIMEYSAVGERYFGKTRAEAIQMYLFEFIDPTDFQWVYSTHQSIRGKKVDYPEYNLSALINIVYVEKKDVVLATIIDITEQEYQAKKYYEKKLNTVELAHEVIRKQMTVAQEIAGLLGETAAETKITLLDLCDSLLEDGEEEQASGRKKKRRGAASVSETEGRG
ncbi:[Fe-Fe] hydrogenase large subunit C-terminal domain-containing protein [Clostridium transplantifaecale]|uniref:[Fe-Fe] hydrogenase large subunit C-terminal domain-containing protein n=1 Tax=Clostridium transplantifaecale TaxID=2479838 RepID=UPI000F6316D9|nr:[Fe-Fe] hydrogenase large subunit C-terminal domain-containing protein [Clostridium transplantifaecale]